jgi:hypothetical protein
MAARKAPAKKAATKHIPPPTGPAKAPQPMRNAPMQKTQTQPGPSHPASTGK